MEIKQKIEKLSDIISDTKKISGIYNDTVFLVFNSESDVENKYKILSDTFSDIKFNKNNNQIFFELNEKLFNCRIFMDLDNFFSCFNEEIYNNNFIIFQYLEKDDFLVFNSKDKKAYSKKKSDVKDIDNLINYIKLLNKLKSISDNNDELNKKLIFYSSKGMFKINYIEKPFSKELLKYDIEKICNEHKFFYCLEKEDFKSIFIDEMQHSLKTFDEHNNILILLDKFESIVGTSCANWQLYLSNFSFIDKMDEEKNKYFSMINKIIDTSTNQIFGVIISSLGSIYSIYKMENIENIKYIILGIFSFFSLIVIHHQFISLYNLFTLKSNFYKKIKDYTTNLKDKNDIKNIKNNILLSIITVVSFIIMIIVLNIIIFYKLYVKNDITYLIILLIMLLLFIIRVMYFLFFNFNIKSE